MADKKSSPEEKEINAKYGRIDRRILKFEAWALGLGMTASLGLGILGLINTPRNPYKGLQTVSEYLDVQQNLENIKGHRYTLERIAKKNPDLINLSKIDIHTDDLKKELSGLKTHPEYITYEAWNQKNVYRFYRYSGTGIGFTFIIGGVLPMLGFAISHRKGRKELKKLEESTSS